MKIRARLLLSIGLLCLLCVGLPGSLRADTVYTYTSNDFPVSLCFGEFCSGTTPTLTITFNVVSGTPLDNLPQNGTAGTDITSDISSWSITDGVGLFIDSTNAGLDDFQVGTNAYGDITAWDISAVTNPDSAGNKEAVNTGGGTFLYSIAYLGITSNDVIETFPASLGYYNEPEPGSTEWDSADVGTWTGPPAPIATTPEPSSLDRKSVV